MGIRKYIYDYETVLQETDGSNATQTEYTATTEMYGDFLSAFDGSSARYYEPDALGSTDALIDESQAVTDRWRYRAFGVATHTVGADATPFTWVGRQSYYSDSETDLYLLGSGTRYYDPATAQFLSEDPIGFASGDPNTRRYAHNNPTNWVDVTGLKCAETDNDTLKECEENLKKAQAKFDTCPEAKKKFAECKKKRGGNLTIECKGWGSSGASARFDPDKNLIQINEDHAESLDVDIIVSSLLAETIRACQIDDWDKVFQACSDGLVSKADYVECYEKSGYQLIKDHHEIALKCVPKHWKEKSDEYGKFLQGAPTFQKHFEAQLRDTNGRNPGDKGYDPKLSHAGRRGLIWDQQCKTKWDANQRKAPKDRPGPFKCPFA